MSSGMGGGLRGRWALVLGAALAVLTSGFLLSFTALPLLTVLAAEDEWPGLWLLDCKQGELPVSTRVRLEDEERLGLSPLLASSPLFFKLPLSSVGGVLVSNNIKERLSETFT